MLAALVSAAEEDRRERRAPENHAYTEARKLAEAASLAEASPRRCIYRIRKRLAAEFEANAGISLSAHALIENHPWKGYRLSPTVLILASDEVAWRSGDHNFRRRRSQLGRSEADKTMSWWLPTVTAFSEPVHISSAVENALKKFLTWLAREPGYRSRIKLSDIAAEASSEPKRYPS